MFGEAEECGEGSALLTRDDSLDTQATPARHGSKNLLVRCALGLLSVAGAVAVLFLVALDRKVDVYTIPTTFTSLFTGSSSYSSALTTPSFTTAFGDSADESTTTTSTKPNIIFILADDLGWNSIGHEDYDIDFTTPTLTAMANEGIVMENYYAQEVCTPARGSLLTGRHPLSIGMQYFMVESAIPWGLELEETTIAQVLSDNGYKTHMLGKWHLGHSTPRYLPTARGFDTFTGMLNGESYYWSKRNPDHPHFKDFMSSDRECFWPYDESDMHEYSTHQYRDMAVEIIEDHDVSDPLFLYMSFQAVHDPFDDVNGVHEFGIPAEYLDGGMFSKIKSEVKGLKRQQYAMALYLMDKAVSRIQRALDEKDMMNNTYIIFSSDNGGCHAGGGKNGPLRGTKGSLFEGGVKVDAFVYSPLLPASTVGLQYAGLMHISDWFPTILQLSDITFTPASGYELDGVSHVDAWKEENQSAVTYPRSVLLYNYYANVDFYTFNMWVNGSFAVRDSQYKLMHAFNSSTYAVWYTTESIDEDDDALDADVRCAPQAGFGDGDFTYYLFDLLADPYETTNLYDSTDDAHVAAKESLYSFLPGFLDKSTELTSMMRGNQVAFQVWKQHSDFIVPWVKASDLDSTKGSFPSDCYSEMEEMDANQLSLTDSTETETETESETESTEASATTNQLTGLSGLSGATLDSSSDSSSSTTSSTTASSTTTTTTTTTTTEPDTTMPKSDYLSTNLDTSGGTGTKKASAKARGGAKGRGAGNGAGK